MLIHTTGSESLGGSPLDRSYIPALFMADLGAENRSEHTVGAQ